MKNIVYIIASVFLCCAAFTGCGGNREVDNRLSKVDALMTDAPDSALALLSGMCPDSMSERQSAWYALLLTKANAKNYLPLDKSLISQAVDYYEGRGDSLEAQAIYYLGYFYSENLILDTALVVLNQAYETALAANDIFYAGMSAREMGTVYRRQFILDEVQKWGFIAKDLFITANKPLHAAWEDLTIANAFLFNGEYDKAENLLDSATKSVYYLDDIYRSTVILNSIELASKHSDYRKVLSLYNSLSNDQYIFTAHDRLNQTRAAIAEGLYDDAEKYLSLAQKLNMIEADSLYFGKMTSKLLAANGDYKKAYEAAMAFADDLMHSDAQLLTNPQTLLLTDNYKLKVENHKLQIQRNREYITALIVLCLLLGIIILLMRKNYKTNIARERAERDRLASDLDTLREDLTLSNKQYNELSAENQVIKTSLDKQMSDLNTLRENLTLSNEQYEALAQENQAMKASLDVKESELNYMRDSLALSNEQYTELAQENQTMKTSLEKQTSDLNSLRENLMQSNEKYKELSERHDEIKDTMDRQKSDFAIEVKGLFARHLDMLNNVSDIWFHNTDKPTSGNSLYKEIRTMLSKMSKIEVFEQLTEIINKHDDNWLTKFMQAYPNLSDSEYRLAVYLYLGFRPATIAVLTGRSNLDAVYTAKHKLKQKLTNICKNTDDPMLKKLF